MKIRIGLGIDVHKLSENKKLFIGGSEIPHYKGCVAHSDGDFLIHAICDALLGAAGLRDIGTYFPDNDTAYKDIDSKILLKKTADIISQQGWKISNIDTVICLEKPKIKDYVGKMKLILSEILNIDKSDIGIKATTTETLGYEGREEGVTAYATALLIKD